MERSVARAQSPTRERGRELPVAYESLTETQGATWVDWHDEPGEALACDCEPWFSCEMGRLRDFEEWAGPWRADIRESAPIPQEQDKPDLTRRHM